MPFDWKKILSDKELMEDNLSRMHRTREDEANLLALPAEINHHKLFAPEGYFSMFQFCVKHLHLFGVCGL
ncbi:MAG: hypothetical protein VYA34_15555 [Myxococcota bacterium]|nr:hypothetical protein [Myxococcota bacterium]